MTTSTSLDDVQLHLVDSIEKAGEFLRWAAERRPLDLVSIDIETGEIPGHNKQDALSPWRGRIRLVQVGDSMQGWAIPWEEWSGVFYQFALNYTGQIACHNIAFEAKWFALQSRWDFPWIKAHDTMLMAQVINPLASAALKTLSNKLIDPRAASMQRLLDEAMTTNGWTWGTVPVTFDKYWSYGALDTVITTRILIDHFWSKCGPGGVYSIPYELEMATRKITTRMELNGARVDLEYSKKTQDEMIQFTERAKEWVQTRYHTSLTSNVQMVRLFESLGANITERTPSGAKSMSKDQLDLLMINGSTEVKALAELALKQRKADKLAGSYFSNFLSDNIDGFVHPSIRTMGARTGRMSITDPALQTLPSRDGPLVRRAFLPKDEDHAIISSDLDQVEFRIAASISNDQALIETFLEADRTGGDVFTDIMRQVYDDNSLVKADPRRGLIKGTVYGKLFGAGVDKMALTAGVPSETMRGVVTAFDDRYPGIKILQKKIENLGSQRLRNEGEAYVNTKTGRRLPCDDNRVYSLTNYLIQGSAAEVFKQNLVKLDQAGLTEMMVVPVHDEIVLQALKQDAKDVMEVVQECMTTKDGWAVPLTSGVDGPFSNWGEKYQ